MRPRKRLILVLAFRFRESRQTPSGVRSKHAPGLRPLRGAVCPYIRFGKAYGHRLKLITGIVIVNDLSNKGLPMFLFHGSTGRQEILFANRQVDGQRRHCRRRDGCPPHAATINWGSSGICRGTASRRPVACAGRSHAQVVAYNFFRCAYPCEKQTANAASVPASGQSLVYRSQD